MYRFVIVESAKGKEVYINLISSSAGRYLSRWPHVMEIIREVMRTAPLRDKRTVIERSMGRNIGTTDIVKTTDSDSIYYARQAKADVFSRFAKNRYPQSCDLLTIVVMRDDNGDFEIQDVWIGPASPAFPGDEHETTDSRVYWQTHALVQDSKVIQTKSIVKDCPY